MYETLFIVGIVFAVLAGLGLAVSVAMFVSFRIPEIMKDANGVMAQKQIEEIRLKSRDAANKRTKVNVFEELEKKAKVRKSNTHSLNLGATTSGDLRRGTDSGTTILKNNSAAQHPEFVILKNIMFVSTEEVI